MASENHGRYRSLDAFLAAYSERTDEKYVKGIFALITLFVLVSPLPKLLKSDFSGFPNAFDTVSELEIDETFLYGVATNAYKTQERNIEKFLKENGIEAKVKFVVKSETSSEIDYVNVILSDMSFERDKSNSIDIGALKSEISKFSCVPEDKLRVFMNDNEEKEKPFKDFIRKIKSVKNIEIIVCIILIAIILLLYGIVREAKKKQAESGNAGATIVETASDEERLAAVLSKIKGAGKVEVYIGYDGNFETVYAFDKTTNTTTRTDDSGGANLTTTVTEEKSTAVFDENKKPLIEKTVAPKITGVIVVAEGAKDVAVRLNILKAVATALNVNEKIIEIFIMN